MMTGLISNDEIHLKTNVLQYPGLSDCLHSDSTYKCREWIVIAATSSAYMVNHYLERKSR